MGSEEVLSISLLGSFRIQNRAGEAITSYTRKTQALLALLSVESEWPLSRHRAIQLLWPQLSTSQGLHNLRQTVLLLQRLFRKVSPHHTLLQVTATHLKLTSTPLLRVDVVELLTLHKACVNHRHRHLENCLACLSRLQTLVELYQGELLEQWSPDEPETMAWHQGWRNSLHTMVLTYIQILIGYLERKGDFVHAEHYARRWVELEPTQEAAHRKLMHLMALDGRRAAAIVHYEHLETLLREQHATVPETDTAALFDSIWHWHLISADGAPHTSHALPRLPLTPFIGRREALDTLAQFFQQPDARLLVLTGPPGAGTTRLAIKAAHEWAWCFRGGVYYCRLETPADRETLTSLLRLLKNQASTSPAASSLPNVSGDPALSNEVLVLVDQAHLLPNSDADRALLLELTQQALVLLTTHQAPQPPLGEVLTLLGLSLPPNDTLDALLQAEAMQLFIDRARRAAGIPSLPLEWLPILGEICRLVEGLPWWIELAAHQLNRLTPRQVLHQLCTAPWTLELDLVDIPEPHKSPLHLVRERLRHTPTSTRATLHTLASQPVTCWPELMKAQGIGLEQLRTLRQLYWLHPLGNPHRFFPLPLHAVLQALPPP